MGTAACAQAPSVRTGSQSHQLTPVVFDAPALSPASKDENIYGRWARLSTQRRRHPICMLHLASTAHHPVVIERQNQYNFKVFVEDLSCRTYHTHSQIQQRQRTAEAASVRTESHPRKMTAHPSLIRRQAWQSPNPEEGRRLGVPDTSIVTGPSAIIDLCMLRDGRAVRKESTGSATAVGEIVRSWKHRTHNCTCVPWSLPLSQCTVCRTPTLAIGQSIIMAAFVRSPSVQGAQHAAQAQLPLPSVPTASRRFRPCAEALTGARALRSSRQRTPGRNAILCAAESNGTPPDFKAWESVITHVKQRDDIKKIMLFGAGPIVIGQVRKLIIALVPQITVQPYTLISCTAANRLGSKPRTRRVFMLLTSQHVCWRRRASLTTRAPRHARPSGLLPSHPAAASPPMSSAAGSVSATASTWSAVLN